MSPEQRQIAVAEACKWTEIGRCNKSCSIPCGIPPAGWRGVRPGRQHLPQFEFDLNACHEMEKVLYGDNDLWRYYINNLRDLTGEFPWLAMAHATAAQRVEAFLRALDLWIDPEEPNTASEYESCCCDYTNHCPVHGSSRTTDPDSYINQP
jgi:hypothetical protein